MIPFNRLFAECLTVTRLSPPLQTAKWMTGLALKLPSVLRARSLGPADDFVGSRFLVRGGTKRLKFENSGLGVVREIFGHCCYGDVRDLKGARHILDLGANAGVFTHFALLHAEGASVTLVEVQPELCEAARMNLARNGFTAQTRVVNALAGGITTDWAREYVRQHPEIKMFNMDEYVGTVGECDFLKCDIEGAEFALLEGPVSWLKNVRRMAIEYHWDHAAGERLKFLVESKGFRVIRKPSGSLGYLLCERKA